MEFDESLNPFDDPSVQAALQAPVPAPSAASFAPSTTMASSTVTGFGSNTAAPSYMSSSGGKSPNSITFFIQLTGGSDSASAQERRHYRYP